ncbi:repetitive organellar protein-like [Daktulosphaira vitifoliae]|uniref:repetitive organellar protein-like n=1 Tax=Daktulosphaira vitifoliae TaxID=58002 RepID=UPI0021A9B789|nr:repetitive organellar protein-like [Daktulosphaira vitifoliae]XP_050546754.1 repetitive organellar protein-like [Daktulosphaira vitifoliae]XP_050546755.1 repetitive organellar protein-like [Daktulosphaira vitifoliae]XP_050546756.1 repetitive organellar protein-like [Daktulosphaira vitifoliae]
MADNMNNRNDNDNINTQMLMLNMNMNRINLENWRTVKKIHIKKASIEIIERSIIKANLKNVELERQIKNVKSEIIVLRNNILNLDNITMSLYKTLADLQLDFSHKKIVLNNKRDKYDVKLFQKIKHWEKLQERLNFLPAIKTLYNNEKEFDCLKICYEHLLKENKELTEEISLKKKMNYKKQNVIILNFATEFNEMKTYNIKEKTLTNLLRNLREEHEDLLIKKRILFEDQKDKLCKLPMWTFQINKSDLKLFNEKVNFLEILLNEYKSNEENVNVDVYKTIKKCDSNQNIHKLFKEDSLTHFKTNSISDVKIPIEDNHTLSLENVLLPNSHKNIDKKSIKTQEKNHEIVNNSNFELIANYDISKKIINSENSINVSIRKTSHNTIIDNKETCAEKDNFEINRDALDNPKKSCLQDCSKPESNFSLLKSPERFEKTPEPQFEICFNNSYQVDNLNDAFQFNCQFSQNQVKKITDEFWKDLEDGDAEPYNYSEISSFCSSE